ncbi:hypothetical protein C8Q80DRAFT_1289245 [Daedaleopsis nitida]|nr:hypothetical protein C8Q80DRAFT_1289245 [Daedaleopsis nitida]
MLSTPSLRPVHVPVPVSTLTDPDKTPDCGERFALVDCQQVCNLGQIRKCTYMPVDILSVERVEPSSGIPHGFKFYVVLDEWDAPNSEPSRHDKTADAYPAHCQRKRAFPISRMIDICNTVARCGGRYMWMKDFCVEDDEDSGLTLGREALLSEIMPRAEGVILLQSAGSHATSCPLNEVVDCSDSAISHTVQRFTFQFSKWEGKIGLLGWSKPPLPETVSLLLVSNQPNRNDVVELELPVEAAVDVPDKIRKEYCGIEEEHGSQTPVYMVDLRALFDRFAQGHFKLRRASEQRDLQAGKEKEEQDAEREEETEDLSSGGRPM